ncbi:MULTISPECIES: hypothetical protein [Halolamina]|uniref:Uncharacterized protein n=1 Tax=Halolamina pelagica TaxID=699431 RepID=A0A1I5NU60_9EURY|nr:MULTISPECIES: hypothetical protein [Halolamina]NHX36480.1 hypothetical protein [Halolamina sp. R1-12]SFP25334.1 hypothetical protein SAMN05216277_102197 [Halolamina pelagica]
METVSLGAPEPILDSLPDDDDARMDMREAVAGWERRINDAIEAADDDGEAVGYVLDAVERIESRMERFDEFVPELRAWGQSPIYAISWRNLYAELIAQLYDHDELGEALDRERNQRLVEDGIRFGDR